MIDAANPPTASEGLAALFERNGLLDGRDGGTIEAESLWRDNPKRAGEIAGVLAEHHRLRRLSFAEVAAEPPLLHRLSRRFLRENFLYPFGQSDAPQLAVADPGRFDAIRAVALALNAAPDLAVVGFDEIELLFDRAGSEETQTIKEVVVEGDATSSFAETVEALQDLARGAPVVRAIDQVLERALEAGATDIHFETGRDNLRVRIRIDGQLRVDQSFSKTMAPAILSRVKILAGLDIAERRLPQDGRANVRIGPVEADLRVAIMPTMYGETAVLRILVKDARLLDFGRIGMSARDREGFEGLLAEPHGMIIVTGPTGSGKTTTLATAISLLNQPSRKIVTVEDPIEYQIAGIHQTQIRPVIGLTFATALRSFLRHDPDIIMVGEMRDGETASIGVQAALTGHLVLTTLHTNTASDAPARLTDMGIEPYLIASTLRGVLGQRLVRRLCERCRRPDPQQAETAHDICRSRGVRFEATGTFHAPVGCEACGNSGYRGRIGLFEVLRIDPEIRTLLRKEPDGRQVADLAQAGGMTTMLADGFTKCAAGLTSVEEVLRATG